MKKNYKRTKYACYFTYFSMSSVFCLPPLLFGAFREMYGISYTLLGTLVLLNFLTQLVIDLIFTFLPSILLFPISISGIGESISITDVIIGINAQKKAKYIQFSVPKMFKYNVLIITTITHP